MVTLAVDGFSFNNDMFQGGCVPSQLEVSPKKPKRVHKAKVVRGRKAQNIGGSTAGLGRRQRSPTTEHVRGPDDAHNTSLALLLDAKLAAFEKRIIQGVADWFLNHTSIETEVVDTDGEGQETSTGNGEGGKSGDPLMLLIFQHRLQELMGMPRLRRT